METRDDCMERTGIVVSFDRGLSKIKLVRHTACGSCGACQLGDDSKDIHMLASNDLQAEIGDIVEVSMPTNSVLSAAFIMYVIPLFGLFLGVFTGPLIMNLMNINIGSDLGSVIFGLLFMMLMFFIIKLNDNRFLQNEKYTAHISTIIQKSKDTVNPLEFNVLT